MYEGWANYETWNVALWLGNDEGLYKLARNAGSFEAFLSQAHHYGIFENNKTPDGVSWYDSKIDHRAIDNMISAWR